MISDVLLNAKIAKLKNVIMRWAKQHNLWYHCGFSTYLEKHDALSEHIVLQMWYEGPLYEVLNYHSRTDLADEFSQLCDSVGFFAEPQDHTTMNFSIWDEGDLKESFRSMLRWQWVCNLLVPDTGDVLKNYMTTSTKIQIK